MLSVFMLSVIMLNVVMLSVVMLSVIMLSVIILNVVMLHVLAPLRTHRTTCGLYYKRGTIVIYDRNDSCLYYKL
jgi:hypothetical protein